MSIDIKKIQEIMKTHMKEQPYEAVCFECGTSLEVCKVDVLYDFDLRLFIQPCKNCTAKAEGE